MLHNYVCEKCGQSFNTWDECYACENGHITTFSSLLEPETQKRMKYRWRTIVPARNARRRNRIRPLHRSTEPESSTNVLVLVHGTRIEIEFATGRRHVARCFMSRLAA